MNHCDTTCYISFESKAPMLDLQALLFCVDAVAIMLQLVLLSLAVAAVRRGTMDSQAAPQRRHLFCRWCREASAFGNWKIKATQIWTCHVSLSGGGAVQCKWNGEKIKFLSESFSISKTRCFVCLNWVKFGHILMAPENTHHIFRTAKC